MAQAAAQAMPRLAPKSPMKIFPSSLEPYLRCPAQFLLFKGGYIGKLVVKR
jgi:hypothetical protein